MAFMAALPEVLGAVGEAGGAEAAGGAAEAGSEGAGKGLFNKIPSAMPGEANKQQNVGESRNGNFQDAANAIRGALRPGGV